MYTRMNMVMDLLTLWLFKVEYLIVTMFKVDVDDISTDFLPKWKTLSEQMAVFNYRWLLFGESLWRPGFSKAFVDNYNSLNRLAKVLRKYYDFSVHAGTGRIY